MCSFVVNHKLLLLFNDMLLLSLFMFFFICCKSYFVVANQQLITSTVQIYTHMLQTLYSYYMSNIFLLLLFMLLFTSCEYIVVMEFNYFAPNCL
jgi:hypothetical protein